MSRRVYCVKYHQELEGLVAPPFPGELGKKIFDQVSQKAWQDWLEHQKKVINELKLAVYRPESQSILNQHAEAFFFKTPIPLGPTP